MCRAVQAKLGSVPEKRRQGLGWSRAGRAELGGGSEAFGSPYGKAGTSSPGGCRGESAEAGWENRLLWARLWVHGLGYRFVPGGLEDSTSSSCRPVLVWIGERSGIISELSPRTQVYRGITARLKLHVFKVCDVTFRCRYTLRNDHRDRADEHIRHLTQSPLCVRAGTTCSTPTSIEHANIRVKSYNENSRERYICNSGFKRKAGTSSLTKCLRNEDTNVTEWTIPSLKCVRDRSLTPQRPPSTVAPARVTPEPDSPSPSGKEPAFSSKSDVAVATKQAVVPGAGLMPSEPPSAGGPGTVKREPSQATPQTTAEVVGRTPTSSLDKPGARSYSFTDVTVAVPILVVVLFGATIVVIRVVRCRQSRQTSWTPGVEMENIEGVPMTGGTDGRDDAENRHAV
ncbi:interleukin-15 receptor subunit alpha [Pteropus alecto]|uniref:interleukin-15 receptor subunit alpha n=1 Tax=Pteropus alecto TaxID=9402 RepID=UPI00076875F2|nr:interleukin-15 receptor subunit alpha [Pteropus alecto]